MNKIYIGDQEINAGGGSGGGGVADASFNELAKVTASALIDLKGLEDNIEEFDDKIEGHVEAIDTQIQTLDANKADSSVVYTKKDIDKADKVTAAALASLDSRVSTLESSSGSGGSGETFDPSYLEDGLLDVSTRVDALEQIDYVETNDLSAFLTADDVSDFVTTNDISAFVTQSAFDSSYVSLDTSVKALDASALAFDASIKELDASVKELASSSGGGGITPAQLDASLKEYTYDKAYLDSSYVDLKKRDKIYEGINPRNNHKFLYPYYSKLPGAFFGNYSYVNCPDDTYNNTQYSIETGYGCHVEGLAGSVNGKFAYGFGVCTRTSHFGEFSCGTFNISRGYGTQTFDVVNSSTHSLFNVGNGIKSTAHNGFEIRRSGDIYIPDVSAAGEYYEKPMINLQQKIYELEARIAVLESAIQTQ